MASKADRAARSKRLAEIGDDLGDGQSYTQVQIKFAKKYKITERQVRRDIEQIRTQWAKEAEAEGKGDVRRNQLRHKLNTVFRKALAAGSYSAAVAAANRLMELDGLKILKVEHSGTLEHQHDVKDMTSDDKRKRLESLMDAANARRKSQDKVVH